MSRVDKIAYIVNVRMPTEKAHGLQIAKMCEAFAEGGVELTLYYPSRQNHISQSIFEYYGISQEAFRVTEWRLPDVIQLSKYIASLGYVLQSFLFLIRCFFFTPEKGMLIYTRSAEIAWVFSLRGYRVIYEAHRWPNSKERLYEWLLKEVDLIVCNSKGTAQAHKKVGSRVLVAPNGVDLKAFDVEMTKKEAREKVGLPQDKQILLYVGNLYEWKGVDTVVDAWSSQLAQNKNLYLVFVGGHDKDRKRLEEKLEKGERRVEFIPPVPHKEVPLYLKSANILLLPNAPTTKESREYTSPIKMFEYMASKRLIVASHLPSITEVLSEKEAFFFSAGNPDDLANTIESAVQRGGTEKMERVYEKVWQYTWRKRAEKIISALEK